MSSPPLIVHGARGVRTPDHERATDGQGWGAGTGGAPGMTTAAAKGSYYQARSKRYLQRLGFHVEPLQLYGWIKTATGLRPVKRDSFGADLLAVSATRTWFCQIKGGASWRSGLAAARAVFAKYPLGPGESQVILGWPPRAREPEIEVCAVGPKAAGAAVRQPPRRKPKRTVLPLFASAR